MPLDLSIVIPAHNEAARIQSGFNRVAPIIYSLGANNIEVIVVDDGSTDDTGRLAAEVYRELPHFAVVRLETNQGKGAAVRLGISVAVGKMIAVLDADMAIDPTQLPSLVAALESSSIAAGSRTIDGSIVYNSKIRTWSGTAFNSLVRRRTSTTLRDTQCGFKGFQSGAARLLACLGLVNGFAYDVEILYLAGKLGLSVQPVPVRWDDVAGSSVHILRDSRRMLVNTLSLRTNNYDCPTVSAAVDVDVNEVAAASRTARVHGVVLARGQNNTLIVLPRNSALAGTEISSRIHGQLGLSTLTDLRNRTYEAI